MSKSGYWDFRVFQDHEDQCSIILCYYDDNGKPLRRSFDYNSAMLEAFDRPVLKAEDFPEA